MWSSGRNESQNPNAQLLGDRLPSTVTEVDDIRNLLSAGVDMKSSLSSKVEENHTKTFGKFDLTNVPVKTAKWCFFSRDCMWASFRKSTSVETYIRGCQNDSFSNTQDIPNMLIGSLLENEQEGEPSHHARRRTIFRRRSAR